MTISSSKGVLSWRPVVVGLLSIAALFASLAASPAGIASPQVGQDEQTLLSLVNAHRAANGLSPLDISPTLTDVALWMSGDMAEKDYFSHTDSLGRNPFQRMADFGYDHNTWKGENLAAGSDTPQMTFDLWRESPGHNDNMLNPNFAVIGLAKAYGPNSTYGWYWATEFGGYDERGSPPPSTPVPTATPEPSPTSTPVPTATPEPSPPSPPAITVTSTPEASPPPISESPSSEAEPTLGGGDPSPPGPSLGIAPPTGGDEPTDDTFESAPEVRELALGWNQFRCPPGSMRLTEVLPVDSGRLMAIYAWDADKGTWRRHLPGVDIPGVNTLTELTDQQTIWILASQSFSLTLPT